MADFLDHETFSRHLNTHFRIYWSESESVEAELDHVSEHQLSQRQERFAIIFRGPTEPVLKQGTYGVKHDEMGEFQLFLVPISRDDQGTSYEAVFNRMLKIN